VLGPGLFEQHAVTPTFETAMSLNIYVDAGLRKLSDKINKRIIYRYILYYGHKHFQI
jgi:hypothetical protein